MKGIIFNLVKEVVTDLHGADAWDAVLVLTYRSDRRLCALAEGFLLGAAPHFGEQAHLTHLRCMHEDDDRCVIRCRFTPA